MKCKFAKIALFFIICLLISNAYPQDNKGVDKKPVQNNNDMASDEDAKKAIDEFEKQLKKPKITEDDIVLAVNILGNTKHPKVLDKLKEKAKYYKSTNKEKIACARGIAKYTNDKTAAGYLYEIFDSNYGKKETKDVDVAALRALGSIAYEPSGKQLIKVIYDEDDDISVAAVEASGEIRSATSIDPLIHLLKNCEEVLANIQKQQILAAYKSAKNPPPSSGTITKENLEQQRAQKLQPVIGKALNIITKQTFATGKDWDNWWANNKSTFKVQ